jgi:Xaa-Pro aminopeptidase
MKGNHILAFIMALFMTTGTGKSNIYNPDNLSQQLPVEFISTYDAPAFDQEVFKLRRQKLMHDMKGEIAIISASTGNDFAYLTGLTGENQAIALLDPSSEAPYTLFVLPRNPVTALWDGERIGVEGAREIYGADKAYVITGFNNELPLILKGRNSISIHAGDMVLQKRISGISKDFSGSFHSDLESLLHEMRVIKDEWEIAQLKKAIEVTALSLRRAMSTVKPGQREYDVQAEIEYVFMKNGLSAGFPSIVGSGPNASILHYTENNRALEDGDLLLMDVGATCRGYVADVTRTIPVNGKFTPPQRELYSLVLHANQEAIKKMAPGQRILDCHHRATEIIVRGLFDLGLITDTTSWWQKRFYIQYRNNHYIGLHVHDVGNYGEIDAPNRDSYILDPEIRGREILPGMVMTIEPGIYLPAGRLEYLHQLFGDKASAEELEAFSAKVRPVYEKYSGIGIRIEDDVLITENGNIVLSDNAPKTIEEIEALMDAYNVDH